MASREPAGRIGISRVRRPKPVATSKVKVAAGLAAESDLDFGLTFQVCALLKAPKGHA